jgi:protein-L-isoaspartate(D-aspartate) O-methyltransferase
MTSEADLAVIRRQYARQTLFAAGVASPALENAFAEVVRERFLGPGPWKVFRWTGYADTPDADPAWLYADVVVAIIAEQRLNNGQPSSHALWLHAADAKPGDQVVHVGAGTGYYTAILAHLVGSSGRVTAVEHNPGLAARATASLAHLSYIRIRSGDGARADFDPADVIYVNAGATRPMDAWLDALKDGGRLMLPLTTNAAFGSAPPAGLQGAFFRIERRGEDFLAKVISGAAYIPGEGMRDAASEAALAAGFANGRLREVTRLYRDDAAAALPTDQCWARASGWALAYR